MYNIYKASFNSRLNDSLKPFDARLSKEVIARKSRPPKDIRMAMEEASRDLTQEAAGTVIFIYKIYIVQGECRTENGKKLSNSQAYYLAQLCLAAA